MTKANAYKKRTWLVSPRCDVVFGNTRLRGVRHVVDKEALVIYSFGSEGAEKRTYDIVEVTLQNVQTDKHIKIQAVVIDSIISARIRIPSKFIRNTALERGIELVDNSTSERIHALIGSDYISEILGERSIGISKRLIAVDSIFGYLIQGKEDEVNWKKQDMLQLAEELGINATLNMTVPSIKIAITNSEGYEEEFVKNLYETIIANGKRLEELERAKKTRLEELERAEK
ncbi:integrase catalytic domain-containing protein [Trichonephila clavipes]|nr:integrase catalytic domain-containing protein [Trichonephila clavipes]